MCTLSDKLYLVPSCTTKLIGGSRVTAYPALLMTRPSTTNRYTPAKPHTPNHSLHLHIHVHIRSILWLALSPVLMKLQVHLWRQCFAYSAC